MRKLFNYILLIGMLILTLECGSRIYVGSGTVYYSLIRNNCDAAWRWMWIKRHAGDIEIYYSFDKYDAGRGWAVKPGLSDIPCFENKTLSTNSKGIRGKVEYAYGKSHDKLRILIIGDSFSFGDDLSDQETYPYYLQQLLPDAEVINLGVHGYGHDQMLIYLKEEGLKYEPDIIILGYIADDAERNMVAFRDFAKPKYDLVNEKLQLRNSPVPDPLYFLRTEMLRSRFVDLLGMAYYKIRIRTGAYAAMRERLTDAILSDIVSTAKNAGAKPVFAYLNNLRDMRSDIGMTDEERIFLDRCNKLKVETIFLRSSVQDARSRGGTMTSGGHYDPKTNQIIASGIKEYLFTNGMLRNTAELP